MKALCSLLVTVTVFLHLPWYSLSQQATAANGATTSRNDGKIRYVPALADKGQDAQDNTTEKIQCYRCNRYKGDGSPCPETLMQTVKNEEEIRILSERPPADRVVKECEVCMKIKTVYEVRNKDYVVDKLMVQDISHFDKYEVISRTCIESKKDARTTDGCIKQSALGGYVERCYCSSNLCNAGSKMKFAEFLLYVITVFVVLLNSQ